MFLSLVASCSSVSVHYQLSQANAKILFSFNEMGKPLCPAPLCSPPVFGSLQESMHFWLKQTVDRDGYTDAQVLVIPVHEDVHIIVGGEAIPSDYSIFLEKFFRLGLAGYAEAKEVLAAGKWAASNAEYWAYFLPLGTPIRNARTVQV